MKREGGEDDVAMAKLAVKERKKRYKKEQQKEKGSKVV